MAPARVAALAVDPRNDSTVYLAAPGGGIWKSTDGGNAWSPQMDSAYSVQVCSVALDPNSPGVLYAGTGDEQSPRPAQGVARSGDGGASWNFGVSFTDQPVCTLAVDPTNGQRILAGSAEGLFLSSDSGASWRKVLPYPVTSAVFDSQGNLYVGMLGLESLSSRNNILTRSSDGGVTWTNLPLPIPAAAASAETQWVSVVARGATLYVIVSYQGRASSRPSVDFYRSTDGGATWLLVPAIGEGRKPVTLFTDAEARNLYVAGADLLTSRNQGDTWFSLTTATDQFHVGVSLGRLVLLGGDKGLELAVPATQPPVEYVGQRIFFYLPIGQYLDITLDSAGIPWAAGPAGLFGMLGQSARPDCWSQTPTIPNPVVPTAGCWKMPVADAAIGNVAASGTLSGNIFAGGNARVYRSEDGGDSFSPSTILASGELRAPFPPLALDPLNAAIAYVAGQRLYRTTDGGATWTGLATVAPDGVVTALTIAPAARQILYAATACLPEAALVSCPGGSTIWRSQNSGQTWALRTTVPGLVNRLTVDPRQANTLYAAIGAFPGGPSATAGYQPGELLRSTDGGASWLSIRANLPRGPINAIVINPSSAATFNRLAQTLYVGTDTGVFVSFDAGALWMAISRGLPPTPITELFLRQSDTTLLAATFGRGIYYAPVAGLTPSLIVNPLSLSVARSQGAATTVSVSLTNLSTARLDWSLTPLDAWLSVPVPAGSLEARGSAAVAFQVSAAGLQVGTYRGRLRITTDATVQDILVTLQVTPAPGTVSIVSGDNATGEVGSTLPALVVQVLDAQNVPLRGVPVNFAITSGGGSLSTRASTTDAAGRSSTLLTLPNLPGAVQVQATAGYVSVTFRATAVQSVRPVLLAGGVVNGATFNGAAPLAPGCLVSIFGRNLAESSAFADSLPLPTSLRTTRVWLITPAGELALPLFFVSPEQVNALLPFGLAPGVYILSVEVASVRGNGVEISIAAAAPGIFTLTADGRGQGIFLQDNGSLVTTTNPALRGSVVSLFATGLGAVNPPVAAGEPGAAGEPFNRTEQIPRVFFDIYEAEVLYSGLAPGFAGLYQVNVRVPARVSPATNIPVSLTVGGAASNRVTIPVQ